MKALSAIRLSVLTDESTSPERQRAANQQASAAIGAHIIGEALDLGVSASKTSPFGRPELGPWLTDRASAFDVVVWWRFDRAVRSMHDMTRLADWAADHQKILVFAEGPGGRLVLDFRQGLDLVTKLLLQVFSFAAEFEAASIRDRVIGAQAALRTMPLRWRGSRPPYGYRPEKLPSGGWTLVPDQEAVAVIERIVAALADGKSPQSIALTLTADGVPSPRDHWREQKGRMQENHPWTATAITGLLRSPALLGHKTHQGRAVLDSDGKAVPAAAEPILSPAEFDAVGALIDKRAREPAVRKDTQSLLLGVALCDSCGGKLYLNMQQSRPGQRPTYKCNSRANGRPCDEPVSLRADWLEEWVAEQFLATARDIRVTETREVPGYDPSIELGELSAEMTLLLEQPAQSQMAQRTLRAKIGALDARMAVLEAAETVPARVEVISGETTYAEEWTATDSDRVARRQMLLNAGAEVRVRPGRAGGWRSLDTSRVTFRLTNTSLAEATDELTAVARDATE
ncbi:recombinase family protein [Streptomyces sp. NPDC050145]|uniref:recombinase family protein n=1 Tax=Streptomyces sp. NPDC050145 TaxID=3365602 RepID=UPI00379678D9